MSVDVAKSSGTNVNMSNEKTLFSWRVPWLENLKKNLERFGYFNKDHAVKVFARENINNPCVIVGAGPSLEKNIEWLRECEARKIAIFSSAHAYMYLQKVGIKPHFVGILDAGAQWIDYVNGGDSTGIPLFADWGCNPEQLEAWKGPIYFYQSDFNRDTSAQGKLIWEEMLAILKGAIPPDCVPVGGHVVGGILHMAKALLNSSDLIFVGCDYSFSGPKFYPYEYEIDKPSVPSDTIGTAKDIFGMDVPVSASYCLFKSVMDSSINEIGNMDKASICINATEGGILGAYPQGLLKSFEYMTLEDALNLVTIRRGLR